MMPELPAERWSEVDALFQRALDVPVPDRKEFLADECAGDDALRHAVEELLAVSDRAEGFMDAPVEFSSDGDWRAFAEFLDSGDPPAGVEPEPDRAGELLGPYRLIREVGRGGMATVYLAERADGQWEQQVAVKVIRRGLDTDDIVRRFLAERQILSSLEHPNIARLLDGGSTADGLPFLVLEFVEGESITGHCDQRELSIDERLTLFGYVCRAVQFAHQSLVVHRDLKPSNVLVTGDGTPKLLDFGIAKLLDDSGGEVTRMGRHRLTPQYASPELMRGDAITTASDVYQLGVMLCVLLAGRRPYDVRGLSSARMGAEIMGAEPERPSRLVSEGAAAVRGLTPERLRRRLGGDLDAIVLKALRKTPADRYASVEALLADIQHHLDGHPVAAARGAVSYRARKFVRLHVVGLATGAAFFGLLAAGSVALAVQRDRALEAAETSEKVAAFLSSVFADADPLTGVGDTMSVRTQLARGARRVDAELDGQPELQAQLFGVIGNAYRGLGLVDEGKEVLKAALAKARLVYEPGDEELEHAVRNLSILYADARELEMALPLDEELVELRRRRLGPNDPQVAAALSSLAGRVRDVVGPDSAEALLRQALAVSGLDKQGETGVHILLNLAYVMRAQGKLDEAEALYREAIPTLQSLDPSDTDISLYLNNLAFLLRERGAYDEAAALYDEALSLHTGLFGAGHPTSLMLASNLGVSLFRGERVEEGEAVMRERVLAAEAQWPDGHWRRATVLQERGMASVQHADGSEAVPAFRESLQMFEETQGERHSWTAAVRVWLAATLIVIESSPEGDIEFERAMTDLEAARQDGTFEGRAQFHANAVADYLEEHGFAVRAARLRTLSGG